ncbi:MAG: NADPH-dependent FMN reductase [Actinomycetota bacterium]
MNIVGIGGTTRANSSTEKALRFALAQCEELGASTTCFGAEDLTSIPHFAPENPERSETVMRLIKELRNSDGIILASPGYHGTISGLVKNAIDYTEDMREDERPYFSGRAVGCIATGAGWQGTMTTLLTLRSIVHALRGWPTPLGVVINTSTPVFDAHREPTDDHVATNLRILAREVTSFSLRT